MGAPLRFPLNPTTGQIYINWKYDGVHWARMSDTAAVGVSSFNTRTGAVTLSSTDVASAGGALLNDPDLTGSPTAPTPPPGDNSTNIATTAFVDAAIAAQPPSGVASFNTRTGAVTLTTADLTGAGGAPLASPALTGNPTAPTQTAGDNSTKLATTSFVATSYAPLNSPALTGAPTAPTVAAADNSTKIATTAWAQANVRIGDNRIINGGFAINQRAQASGTPLSAAAYGHDRWKAGASGCTYTFTVVVPDTSINITAGTLTQVIEATFIEGGVYTLSWTGNAQARVYQGTPTGPYTPGPSITTAALTAGTNTIIEFNTGSVSKVKFESGSVATAFNRQSITKTLLDCQRYYARTVNTYGILFSGNVTSTGIYTAVVMFPVQMRAAPTVTLTNLQATSFPAATGTVTPTIYGFIESRTANATAGGLFASAYTADAEL